jgi:hypothetical protein
MNQPRLGASAPRHPGDRSSAVWPSRRCAVAIGIASMLAPLALQAAPYTVDGFTIEGGGGSSTGGVYAVSGTIGQPEAGAMSGGSYTLVGGFWGMVAAIQTPGAPCLGVLRSNATVVVFWPQPAPGWTLEFTTNLPNASAWTAVPPPYSTNLTSCLVTEPAAAGQKFYRLRKP